MLVFYNVSENSPVFLAGLRRPEFSTHRRLCTISYFSLGSPLSPIIYTLTRCHFDRCIILAGRGHLSTVQPRNYDRSGSPFWAHLKSALENRNHHPVIHCVSRLLATFPEKRREFGSAFQTLSSLTIYMLIPACLHSF